MSDTFIKGLKRALANKKSKAGIKPVKSIGKFVVGFDEKLYQATIISEMVKLIHKTKGVMK